MKKAKELNSNALPNKMHNPRQNSHLEHFLLVFVCHLSMLGSTGGVIIFIISSHCDATAISRDIFALYLHCTLRFWVFKSWISNCCCLVWLDTLDTELMCRLGLTNHFTVVAFQALDSAGSQCFDIKQWIYTETC